MNSTFTRAALGFFLLTAAIAAMALTALWAIERFGGEAAWASLLVVAVTLVAEIAIYLSTLHEPISEWIKEPARQAEAERQKLRKERA